MHVGCITRGRADRGITPCRADTARWAGVAPWPGGSPIDARIDASDVHH